MKNFKREYSAGCVVYKRENRESDSAKTAKIEFLLGKHSGYHKWVLPKGLIEEGEKGWQTAVRETEEEMNVKARPLHKKPIHIEKYVYHADLKNQQENSKTPRLQKLSMCGQAKLQNSKQFDNEAMKQSSPIRRVARYQESGGSKVKVFKTVSFYLAKYVSGNLQDHGWEMEDADWFNYEKALELMAFKGEREALEKAYIMLQEKKKQPSLFS